MKGPMDRVASWLQEHTELVGAFVAGGLALALYVRSVNFGFFGDDPSGHFRYIEHVPWTAWFTSSPGFFFRPLVFIVYKLLWVILGGYFAPGFHLALVILHVSNTVLLGVFASALSRRPTYGWLAAILFATFPLSHEAVAGVDALAHPLSTFWVLLALVLFEHGHRTGQKAYLWAVHPIVLLALLTHENGLVIPVLLLILDLILFPPASARALLRRPVLQYFVVPALYLLWWLQVPKDASLTPHTLGALLRNALPFLQVAAYPVLPFVHLSVAEWGELLMLVGLTLLLTFVSARALGTVRLWLFAVAWMLIVALPSVLFLDWDYLHSGPHLYYLAAVGTALLWAAPLTAIFALAKGPATRRWAAVAVGALVTVAIVLPPLRFVSCHLDLWEQATALVRLVSVQASAAPAGRDLVLVNLPAFITSNAEHPRGCPATYPFVTTGVVIFPPYAELPDFIRVNSGSDRQARGGVISEYDPNWPPRYGEAIPVTAMRKTLQHNQVYVFEIDTWSLRDLSAAWQPDARQVQAPLATFGDLLALERTRVQENDGNLTVTLQWQVRSVPAEPLTAFVHVYDREGKLLAQHDGPLGQNGFPADYVPLALWQPSDGIQEVHTVSLSTPLPSDGYTVAVGLYDQATVKRLPVTSPDGAALRDDLYVLGR